MKFTLTTAFYNNSFDVENLYKSICDQTYKNWEWIVTDDFSEQNCSKNILLDICKKDRRVKYVEQDFKKQMFWNPQIFCKNAEIIVQLDSDDKILPKGLEVYHHFFTKFPDVILIFSPAHNYDNNGNWKWYEFCDTRIFNNLSSGSMTFFRAWRNNPNINFDFNPENKMKYYFNDYSILCSLEEHGKILSLPRTLYNRTFRENSISTSLVITENLEKERIGLTNLIKKRRHNPEFDSFNRFFEPMLDLKFCFVDKSFNESDKQFKISFYSELLDDQKQNLLKELYFDHDINFNKIDGDEDYLFFHVQNIEDVKFFIGVSKRFAIPNCTCVLNKTFIKVNNKTKTIESNSDFLQKDALFSDVFMNNCRYYFIEHGHFKYYRIIK